MPSVYFRQNYNEQFYTFLQAYLNPHGRLRASQRVDFCFIFFNYFVSFFDFLHCARQHFFVASLSPIMSSRVTSRHYSWHLNFPSRSLWVTPGVLDFVRSLSNVTFQLNLSSVGDRGWDKRKAGVGRSARSHRSAAYRLLVCRYTTTKNEERPQNSLTTMRTRTLIRQYFEVCTRLVL